MAYCSRKRCPRDFIVSTLSFRTLFFATVATIVVLQESPSDTIHDQSVLDIRRKSEAPPFGETVDTMDRIKVLEEPQRGGSSGWIAQ